MGEGKGEGVVALCVMGCGVMGGLGGAVSPGRHGREGAGVSVLDVVPSQLRGEGPAGEAGLGMVSGRKVAQFFRTRKG